MTLCHILPERRGWVNMIILIFWEIPARISKQVKLVKLVTIVEGDPKAPISIDSTPSFSKGRYFFSLDWSNVTLIHTLQYWILSKDVSSTIFEFLVENRPEIESRYSEPLVNTLTARPMKILKRLRILYKYKDYYSHQHIFCKILLITDIKIYKLKVYPELKLSLFYVMFVCFANNSFQL